MSLKDVSARTKVCMNRKTLLGVVGAMLLVVSVGVAVAATGMQGEAADPDLTEEEAEGIATDHVGGTAQSVELERENGPVYEVVVEGDNGEYTEVEVHGDSGEVLEVENEHGEEAEIEDDD